MLLFTPNCRDGLDSCNCCVAAIACALERQLLTQSTAEKEVVSMREEALCERLMKAAREGRTQVGSAAKECVQNWAKPIEHFSLGCHHYDDDRRN